MEATVVRMTCAWCAQALGIRCLYCPMPCHRSAISMGQVVYTSEIQHPDKSNAGLMSIVLWLCTLNDPSRTQDRNTFCLLSSQTILLLFWAQLGIPVLWESVWVARTCWLITHIAYTAWITLPLSKWGFIFFVTKSPGPAHGRVLSWKLQDRKGCSSGPVVVNTGCP